MAVFICYRREDAEGEARALYARLAEETDERNLFLDHDAIGAGERWRERIDDALGRVEAALVVIGPQWAAILTSRTERGDADVVRSEIASCLGRKGISVIPVLVKGATMPSASSLPDDVQMLAERNAIEVRASAWKDDTARLVSILRKSGALPISRRHWIRRATVVIAVAAIATGFFWARVEVPDIPQSMTMAFARPLVTRAGLRLESVEVREARFGGNVVGAAARGIRVVAGQRPAPGTMMFRGQTVEVDLIRREPYRLVCRGGGLIDASVSGDDVRFELHPGGWSLGMKPGTCAWVDGPIHPNQAPTLRPLGFKEQMPTLFAAAPGRFLTFCAYSIYERANASESERLVALNYAQFLSPDDNGKLNPTVNGHVCDESS